LVLLVPDQKGRKKMIVGSRDQTVLSKRQGGGEVSLLHLNISFFESVLLHAGGHREGKKKKFFHPQRKRIALVSSSSGGKIFYKT
jgi:hypothetical protein